MDKAVHTFLKRINPKVNVRAQLEFEITYYAVIVQYNSHYVTKTPPIECFLRLLCTMSTWIILDAVFFLPFNFDSALVGKLIIQNSIIRNYFLNTLIYIYVYILILGSWVGGDFITFH